VASHAVGGVNGIEYHLEGPGGVTEATFQADVDPQEVESAADREVIEVAVGPGGGCVAEAAFDRKASLSVLGGEVGEMAGYAVLGIRRVIERLEGPNRVTGRAIESEVDLQELESTSCVSVVEGAIGPNRWRMAKEAGGGKTPLGMLPLIGGEVASHAIVAVSGLKKWFEIGAGVTGCTGRIGVGAEELKPIREGGMVVRGVFPGRGRVPGITGRRPSKKGEKKPGAETLLEKSPSLSRGARLAAHKPPSRSFSPTRTTNPRRVWEPVLVFIGGRRCNPSSWKG
jgi:hypothetical protein